MKRIWIKTRIAVKTFTQRLFITMNLYDENGLANHAAAGAYGFMLSMVPMLLIIAFFILTAFKPAPQSVAALLGSISFLELVVDEQWLTGNFLTVTRPGISGVISVLSILWAGRILALSMQRGLKIIFKGAKKRSIVKDTFITLSVELAVLLFVLMFVFGSQPALFFYKKFDYLTNISAVSFWITNISSYVYPILILGLVSFLAYRFTPVNPPRKTSALQGALFCALSYGCTSVLLGFILSQVNYNLLYGALGNIIFMLVNVYFFFLFFFAGAQFAYVVDKFNVLLFTRFMQSRRKILEDQVNGKSFRNADIISKLFFSAEGRIKRYMHNYKKGEKIFSQGETGNDIFFLLEGEVEIIICSPGDSDGMDVNSVSIIKPCSFFGEIGYLLSESRSATAIAKTDMSALTLPPVIFDEVLKIDTSLDRTLIENLSRRLVSTNEKLAGS